MNTLLERASTSQNQEAQTGIRSLLLALGEDPTREGLSQTPHRVVKAMLEMTAGYTQNPGEILRTTFGQDENEGAVVYGGMVVLSDIEMRSMCEHHLLPFVGRVHIAYIPGPDGRVVGISKLARLVDCFAKRLQLQERLTAQIADSLEKELGARGVMVRIEAEHYCMKMRGCCQGHSVMTTQESRGLLKHDQMWRQEALQLLKGTSQ